VKRKPLPRGTSRLKRETRIRPIGRRGIEARKQIKAVRVVVMERAGARCERCGLGVCIAGRLDLHHKRSRSQGGTHEAENLAALCRLCHDDLHAGRAADSDRWIVTRKEAAKAARRRNR